MENSVFKWMNNCSPISRQKLLWLFIVIYPLLFLFQGGDLTDTGFLTTEYHFFFDYYEENGFLDLKTVFTYFLGASLLKVFGQIIFLKISYYFLVLGTVYMVYWGLKPKFEKKHVLLFALFVGEVFCVRWTHFTLDYDVLSLFLLTGSAVLFSANLGRRNNAILFLSAFFAALSIFTRIPNVLVVGVFLIYSILENIPPINKEKPREYRFLKFFLFLFINLALLNFILFICIGGKAFFESVSLLFSSGQGETADGVGYSLKNLWSIYWNDGLIAIRYALIMFFVFPFFGGIKSKKIGQFVTIGVFLFLLLYKDLKYQYSYDHINKYIYLGGILVFTFFWMLDVIKNKGKERVNALIALGFGLSLAQMAGTNTGLALKMGYMSIFMFPVVFLYFEQKKDLSFSSIYFSWKPIIWVFSLIICVLSILPRIGWIYHSDKGLLARSRAVYPIKVSPYLGVFSNKSQVDYIQEIKVIFEGSVQLKNSSSIFVYGHKPAFYVILDKKPFIKEYWLNNAVYTPEYVWAQMEKKVGEMNAFPVLIDTKQNILGKKGEVGFIDFINTHLYSKSYSSDNFDIWIRFNKEETKL
ncbi:MAG: hypothetical protein ACI9YL_000091 [Luteibaculaceae bacterium]|jgi:hypothetical protein